VEGRGRRGRSFFLVARASRFYSEGHHFGDSSFKGGTFLLGVLESFHLLTTTINSSAACEHGRCWVLKDRVIHVEIEKHSHEDREVGCELKKIDSAGDSPTTGLNTSLDSAI